MSNLRPLKILVVEDSATQRQLFVTLLRGEPGIGEVLEARDGLEAVDLTRAHRPDLVLMDVRMPKLDGLGACKRIMIEAPTPIVLMSDVDVESVRTSMTALNIGALTVMRKPPPPSSPHFAGEVRHLLFTVKALARVRVVSHFAPRPVRPPTEPPALWSASRAGSSMVAIAASTGGPAALRQILSGLPAGLPAPILLVQHIAPGFTDGLSEWLSTAGPLAVGIAEDGQALLPGRVYLAPDNCHLALADPATIALNTSAPISGFRPSADILFQSLARWLGTRAIGVILTGMGSDGAAGLASVRRAGGRTIAQDEHTSLVHGMPQAAIAAGAVDEILPVAQIAARILQWLSTPRASSE